MAVWAQPQLEPGVVVVPMAKDFNQLQSSWFTTGGAVHVVLIQVLSDDLKKP